MWAQYVLQLMDVHDIMLMGLLLCADGYTSLIKAKYGFDV